jgi:macrolide-specific efflux system membrane fusion protein
MTGLFAFWKMRSSAEPETYITGTITKGTLEDAVTATGVLEASQYVDIGTQVSGILKKIAVQIGQTVQKGDLLAQIDPTLFRAQVIQEQANLKDLTARLASAKATLKLATQRFERNRNLVKSDAVSIDEVNFSEAEFERSKAAIDAINAQIEKAQGSLDAAAANLGFTKISAPIDGTVIQIQAREGQTLNATQTAPILFRLADMATMTVKAQVSEADVQRIRPGASVYFTSLGDPETKHEGKVRGMEPSPTTTTPPIFYNTLFDVPNPGLALMPSMTAQVFFPMMHRDDVLLMPLAAIDYAARRPLSANSLQKKHGTDAGTRVFVLRDGKPVEVCVALGMKNRVTVEVVSGLSVGDQVITGPIEMRQRARPR